MGECLSENRALAPLFVSMLQCLGIPAREFATSNVTMRGLKPA